ncbi:MAG: ABC transporter, partial [Erythrobacter sp.]|nr:ABC transporter [Erythrobacter sp.]
MIAREAAKYPLQIALALAALLVTASVMSLAIPYGLKLVVDRGFGGAGEGGGDIDRWFRYLLLLVSVLGLGTAVRFYFVSWLGERVVADIREKVYTNLLRLSPAFFEENSPKEISSRMTSDTAVIETVVGTTVSVALRNTIMAILGTGYLFWLAPQLTVWLLAGIPVVIVPIALFGKRLRDVSRTSQDR